MQPLVTFDCYGTLIDWKAGIARALRERFPELRRWDDERILEAYVMAEARVERAVLEAGFRPYREVLWEAVCRLASRYNLPLGRSDRGFLAASLPAWTPFPDTNPALERLAPEHRLGVVSNVDRDLLEASLRHLTVEVDVLITAGDVESYKPEPAHFRAARREAGGEGGRLLHVAQSLYHDVRPARSLGLPVLWVNREGEDAGDGPEPTAEVSDLAEAAEWIVSRAGQG